MDKDALVEALLLAMVADHVGDDVAARRLLKAAKLILDGGVPDNVEIVPQERHPKQARGRPPLTDDPDKPAIDFMDHVYRKGRITGAKALARLVLRNHAWRRTDKARISESDVKRLADKWKKIGK